MDVNALALALLSLVTGFIFGGGAVAWYIISSAYKRAERDTQALAKAMEEFEKTFKVSSTRNLTPKKRGKSDKDPTINR